MVGEAIRAETTARAVGLDLFTTFQSSIEEWITKHRPDLAERAGAAAVARMLSAMVVGVFVQHAPGRSRTGATTWSPCPCSGPARRPRSCGPRRAEHGLPDGDGHLRGSPPPRTLTPVPLSHPTKIPLPSPPRPSRCRPRPCGGTASTSPTCPRTTPTSATWPGHGRPIDPSRRDQRSRRPLLLQAGRPQPSRRRSQPVELWIIDAVQPTLVAAGMKGGSEAYEEFVVCPLGEHTCEATLMLWSCSPTGSDDDASPLPWRPVGWPDREGGAPHEGGARGAGWIVMRALAVPTEVSTPDLGPADSARPPTQRHGRASAGAVASVPWRARSRPCTHMRSPGCDRPGTARGRSRGGARRPSARCSRRSARSCTGSGSPSPHPTGSARSRCRRSAGSSSEHLVPWIMSLPQNVQMAITARSFLFVCFVSVGRTVGWRREVVA